MFKVKGINHTKSKFARNNPYCAYLKKHYNAQLKLSIWGVEVEMLGVIDKDGKTMFFWGLWNDLECYSWQSKNDLKRISEDRDPISEPACEYKIQPEKQGKLVWLIGSPGSGKSTLGHLMSKKAGYVYYEADSAREFLNPFIPSSASENPTKLAFRQKPLKVCNITDCLRSNAITYFFEENP